MGVTIITGDCRKALQTLPSGCFQSCVTSPPYFGLRDYGVKGQIGLEATPDAFVAEMVAVFREVRRVLRDDGTLWLNLGDSYCNTDKWGGGGNAGKNTIAPDGTIPSWAVRKKRRQMPGLKPKDLIGIPWRVAFALQADGWWLRSAIVWAKPNPMPESVTDRPTSAYEMVFLMTKSDRYFYDGDAIREEMTASSIQRLSQDIEGQTGSARANGGTKTNGTMKAVARKSDKRRGHSRCHAGFNDRWDSMTKEEQLAGGRNARNVWTIATKPFSEAHFATFPPELAARCIRAGSKQGDSILDPFGGAGTTGLVADQLLRNATLIELNPQYADIARRRIHADAGMFSNVHVNSQNNDCTTQKSTP